MGKVSARFEIGRSASMIGDESATMMGDESATITGDGSHKGH